jgi:hypothetical protein
MNAGQLYGMELGIAEDVTLILDYLSRLVQGVCGGDWHVVHDKARVVWIRRFHECRGRVVALLVFLSTAS